MQVKQRLRLNSFISVISTIAVLALVILTIYRVNMSLEALRIADAIVSFSFERLMLRTDLHRTGSERSKTQLIAKHKQIGELLKEASQKFSDSGDKKIVGELLANHELIGKFSKTIREYREKLKPRTRPGALAQETEDRLLSQLNMRVYETILLGGKLQESSNKAVISSLKLAGGGILFVLLLVAGSTLINSWTMGRSISDRVRKLQEGAERIGHGDLCHLIDIRGDDELTELSAAFNVMTAKLSESYKDLEKEVERRRLAEERLHSTLEELEIRVEERTQKLREAEAAMSLANAYNRSLIEVSLDPLVTISTEGKITDVNAATETATGCTRTELIGTDFSDYFTEPEKSRAGYQQVFREGSVRDYEIELRHRGGRIVPVLYNASVYRNELGEVLGVFAAARDITKQKQAQMELQELNKTLEQRIQERTAELQSANEKLSASRVAALNLMEDALADRQQAEKVSVELFNEVAERQRAEAELARLNRALKALSDNSQAIVRARDEQDYLNYVCKIIVRDCGYSMVWIGFAEDDEAKSVRPVAHSGFEEGYLETMGITWSDTERGRGPTGTAVRTGKMAACPNMLTDPAFMPWREQAIKRGYSSSIVFPLIAANKIFGAVTIYSKEADPFSDGEIQLLNELADNLSYGIEVLRIRAAREKAQEALQRSHIELAEANKELESFIYSVSHDLRAPLRAISGFSNILASNISDRINEKEKDYFDRIQNGAARMSQLIDDLLDLSRISQAEIYRREIDLSNMASTIIAGLRETAPDRMVDVNIQAGIAAQADPRVMEAAMSNLLGNAWKFTSKTEPASIEFGTMQQDGKTVYYIRDNGAGFDPAYSDKMFLPFHRLHTREEFEGTGIGLAIVERIIRRHGGTIWAEGETGKGAIINFTLG